jgi:hypothetical protein
MIERPMTPVRDPAAESARDYLASLFEDPNRLYYDGAW